MAVRSMGYPPIPQYIFIDGGYLRGVLEGISKRYYEGDRVDLAYNDLLYAYEKKFYYDALPNKKISESEDDYNLRCLPTTELFNSLRSIPGCHVYLGNTVRESKKNKQKGVDVQLSVHMLMHTFRKNISKATLLAGDADFLPLIEALVLEGLYVTLWFEQKSASKALIYAADAQQRIEPANLLSFASGEFKFLHPIPSVNISVDSEDVNREGFSIIKKGKCKNGDALIMKGNELWLAYPNDEYSRKYTRMSFNTEENLIKLAEDYGMIVHFD